MEGDDTAGLDADGEVITAALGPDDVVQAPASGAPAQSLLRAALVIPHADGDMRWANGIEFDPLSCDDAVVFDPCVANGNDLVNTNNHPGIRKYTPFVVDAYDACSTLSWQNADYEARARQLLALRESKAVAKEFWTGTKIPGNPHLAAGGAVTNVGTGLSPHNGLGALVQALADGNGGPGMIHVRHRLLQILVGQAFLRYENGKWYTATGAVVVADAGYPGTGPAGEAIGNTAGAITEWAYATDLVEVHREANAKVYAKTLTAETVNAFTNRVVVRAQRMYAPIWNGCVLAAVSITTPATDV